MRDDFVPRDLPVRFRLARSPGTISSRENLLACPDSVQIRYDTIRYATYDTIRYDTIRHDATRHVRYDRIRYDTIRYSTIQSVQQKQQDLQSSSSSSSQTASCSSSSVWNPHPHVTLLIGPKPLTFTLSSLYSLLHQLHFLQGHSAQQSMSAHQLVSSSTMSSLYWS